MIRVRKTAGNLREVTRWIAVRERYTHAVSGRCDLAQEIIAVRKREVACATVLRSALPLIIYSPHWIIAVDGGGQAVLRRGLHHPPHWIRKSKTVHCRGVVKVGYPRRCVAVRFR